ncbi:Steroid 17-alpha-hydroxylase/17,20 lyase [Termitomyces sp. T112]|nr:Steroid 17-alpha-hydroxylase/17,20 lyase [Termitomyces sp. T112]
MLDIAHQLPAFAVILIVALGLGVLHQRRPKSDESLPPGPPGVPLLGNLLDVPGEHLATYFRRLFEVYGGIVSLKIASFRLVLIGDLKIAKELLEKRAARHSSRPAVYYIRHHVDPMQALWPTIEEGRDHTLARKLTTGVMSTVRAGKTEPLQEFEAILNLQRLLDDGGTEWFRYMNLIAADSFLTAAFGMHSPTGHESDFKEVLGVIDEIVAHTAPSASIVNVFPFLDLLPGPMPWRIRAQAFQRRQDAIYKELLDEAVTGKASGMNTWAGEFVREGEHEGNKLIRGLTAAGIDTTAISLQIFVLACVRYPEWIPTAQKELDAVVGIDRLPSFKDRPFLPYVEAIVRETYRWRPAARFGIPHQSIADDVIEYQGREYFIPKGSIIFSVTWAIEHDRSKFEDHDRFMPERFLDARGNLKSDYETSAFGFGRRGCPGIPFAERTLWINIATMLWTFNIRRSDLPDPKTGLPFRYDDSDAAFSGNVSNRPSPFPAVFEPRSPQRTEVARREWAECEKDLTVLLPAPKEI